MLQLCLQKKPLLVLLMVTVKHLKTQQYFSPVGDNKNSNSTTYPKLKSEILTFVYCKWC